eukprot:157849-Chlamydomonas_euryale.AAC.7
MGHMLKASKALQPQVQLQPKVARPQLLKGSAPPRVNDAKAILPAAFKIFGVAVSSLAVSFAAYADNQLGEQVFNNNCGERIWRNLEFESTSCHLQMCLNRVCSAQMYGCMCAVQLRSTTGCAMSVCMILLNTAACHAGGKNAVVPERVLSVEAMDKFLDGGFKVESIIYQVTNGKGAMPAWGAVLDEEEIEAVAKWAYEKAKTNSWTVSMNGVMDIGKLIAFICLRGSEIAARMHIPNPRRQPAAWSSDSRQPAQHAGAP